MFSSQLTNAVKVLYFSTICYSHEYFVATVYKMISSCIAYSFGVCVPYSGSSSICNRVFTGRVDYVYVPYSRGQVDLALDQLERVIGSMISLASDTCQNLFSRFLCNSFIFGCGSETSFSSPMSVCPEECNLVQRECPELWAALGSSLLRGFDFTNCSTVGRVLEPLPHCCTDAGIGGRSCFEQKGRWKTL